MLAPGSPAPCSAWTGRHRAASGSTNIPAPHLPPGVLQVPGPVQVWGLRWVPNHTPAVARGSLALSPPSPLPGLAAAAPPERGQVGLLLLLHPLQGWGAAMGTPGTAGAHQAAIPCPGPHRRLLHLHQQLRRQAAERGHRRVGRPALRLQVVVTGRALQHAWGGEATSAEDPSPLRVAGSFSERHCKRARESGISYQVHSAKPVSASHTRAGRWRQSRRAGKAHGAGPEGQEWPGQRRTQLCLLPAPLHAPPRGNRPRSTQGRQAGSQCTSVGRIWRRHLGKH